MKFNQEQLEVLIEALNQKDLSISVEIEKLYAEQDKIAEEKENLQHQLNEILYKDYDLKSGTWYIMVNDNPWPHNNLLTILKVETVLEHHVSYTEYIKRTDDGEISFRVNYSKCFKESFIRSLNDHQYKIIDKEEATKKILELLKL